MCTKTQNCDPCWYFRQLPGPKKQNIKFLFLKDCLSENIYLTTTLFGTSKRQTRPTVSTAFFLDMPIAYDAFPSLLSFSLCLCGHLWSAPSICSFCRCGLLNPISKDCFCVPKGRDILSSPPHL